TYLTLHDLPSVPPRRSSDLVLLPRIVEAAAAREPGRRQALSSRHEPSRISIGRRRRGGYAGRRLAGLARIRAPCRRSGGLGACRSEEHTSELQSREKLVCRL